MCRRDGLFRFLKIRIVHLFLVMNLVVCTFAACNAPIEEGEGEFAMEVLPAPGTYATPYSTEIYVFGEWLYYCGSEYDSGLYAYNLKTREDIQITEDTGIPLRTSHGFFYNIKGKVYEIQEFALKFLCELPEKAVLVDYNQDTAYWIVGREALYAGKADAEKIVLEEAARVLYRISEEEKPILRVKILDEKAYVERFDGLYLVDFKTLETKCILKEEISLIVSSVEEDYLLVRVKSGDEGLYVVFPENNTVQKIDGIDVNFALLHEGNVFYNGKGIRSYSLKDGNVEILSDENYQDRGGSYGGVAFYDHYLVLRGEFICDIYLFDVQTGEIEHIIPEE